MLKRDHQVAVVPILLSGGKGARLWPMSRMSYPKQLLSLFGGNSLIQQTALRASDRELFSPPIVLANADHRFVIAEQLRAVGIADATIVLETIGRNTAPAAAVAALIATRTTPDSLLLIMPADHVVLDIVAFREAVIGGIPAARSGRLVLFGIAPNSPSSAYGYIRLGPALTNPPAVHLVVAFDEKPDRITAEGYLASGEYRWNSGIFLMSASVLIQEFEHHAPEVLEIARAALNQAEKDLDFVRLAAEPLRGCPDISLDHAIMERTDRAVVIPVDFRWTDIGSWSALWEISEKDEDGNVLLGNALAQTSSGCYLRSEGPLLTTLGVENLVVIATPDAILVTNRGDDKGVKDLVERLQAHGYEAATVTQCVHRPWGSYQILHGGDRFQVKRITVKPGAKLSLQRHFHRAEHWVIVNGTAIVTLDGEQRIISENESIYVPVGTVHRLENPGRVPLNVIEVQSGCYLGENDIVRLEDIYARLGEGEAAGADAQATGLEQGG